MNALRFGIPNTGMATPPTFSDEDRWNIGFYVAAIRSERCDENAPKVPLDELANTTDDELGLAYGEPALGCLRLEPTGRARQPRGS